MKRGRDSGTAVPAVYRGDAVPAFCGGDAVRPGPLEADDAYIDGLFTADVQRRFDATPAPELPAAGHLAETTGHSGLK